MPCGMDGPSFSDEGVHRGSFWCPTFSPEDVYPNGEYGAVACLEVRLCEKIGDTLLRQEDS